MAQDYISYVCIIYTNTYFTYIFIITIYSNTGSKTKNTATSRFNWSISPVFFVLRKDLQHSAAPMPSGDLGDLIRGSVYSSYVRETWLTHWFRVDLFVK